MSINGLNPLAYIGVDSPNPAAQVIKRNTDPTPNDSQNFNIGDIWINQNTNVPNTASIFILTSLSENIAVWTEIGSDGNILHVLGGTNINVVNALGNATVNLNPSVVLAGSLTATTNITSTTGSVGAATGLSTTTGDVATLSGNFTALNTAVSPAASIISFTKRRGVGPVASGDGLGAVAFVGFDGAINQLSAVIRSDTTGTIGAGRVPSRMIFSTSPDAVGITVDRVIIDQNGNLTVTAGGNLIVTNGQIVNQNGGILTQEGNIELDNNDNTVNSSTIIFEKSKNFAAVVAGDELGTIDFNGESGVLSENSAYIKAEVVGTVGAGRVPSQLTFATTPDAVSAALPRVVINANGRVDINGVSSGSFGLFVDDSINSLFGSVVAAEDVGAGRIISVSGDLAPVLGGSTTFTNVTVANVPGGDKLTIDSQSANPGVNTGFIKIYVGTTPVYIPYFDNIAP